VGRCLWMRMDAGPDDAAERIVGDRHVGFGLRDVRMGRRGVLSGGARLLGDGVGTVMRVILGTYGAADTFGAWGSFC